MPSKVEIDVVADVSRAVRQLDALDRQVDQTGTGVAGFSKKASTAMKGLAATATVALAVDFGKELVDTGKRVDLLNNRVNTVFPTMSTSIRTWADQVNESFGMSRTEVAGLAAATADLLKPIGLTEQAAGSLSIKVQELANAHSLWSPEISSAAEASDILNKALLGERDGLIALGLKVSDAQVDAQVLADKQAGLTFASEEAARAAATLTLITNQSADAMKFASSEGAKNALKTRELQAKWADLKETLAVAVIPVLEKVIDALLWLANTGIPGVIDAAQAFANGAQATWAKVRAPIDAVISAVEKLHGLIRSIPSLPDIGGGIGDLVGKLPGISGGSANTGTGFREALRTAASRQASTTFRGGNAATLVVNQTIGPGADPSRAGKEVVEAIQAYERAAGTAWRSAS